MGGSHNGELAATRSATRPASSSIATTNLGNPACIARHARLFPRRRDPARRMDEHVARSGFNLSTSGLSMLIDADQRCPGAVDRQAFAGEQRSFTLD
jgi:hypothetical protein